MTMLVHALTTSCVDYCNTVLARSLLYITNKLQHMLNMATRIITRMWQF